MKRTTIVLASLCAALWLGWAWLNADPARPTPSTAADVPTFLGSPAQPRPVALTEQSPIQHPYLAGAGVNSMHNDASQTDSYPWSGPLGHSAQVSSRQFHRLAGSCVAQSFTQAGPMVGTCVSPFGVTLVARDPESLEVLARQIITRWLPIGQKFSGGVYFHLDHRDRVLLATNELAIQLWKLAREGENWRWQLDESLDLAEPLNRIDKGPHHIIDVMPDWQGNYWFITRAGIIGSIDRAGQNGHAIQLGEAQRKEGIDNALAVGKNGVFVVSSHAMYNFSRDDSGKPSITWRAPYDRGSAPKEGTMGWGSGTTPTLVGNDYVAITDNADGRVNVMVYAQAPRNGSQQICKHPIFLENRGTTENSLAAVGLSLIAENNFGYSGPKNIPQSEPGLARVDIRADGSGCDTAWEKLTITSPSAVPKVSTANGLIYLYTRDDKNPEDLHAWYFTAVDFHTGDVVYKQLTGTGWLFNNHYGSISISPDGAAYVGMMGGLVKITDNE
ncbi:hypothetical protein A3709_07870 [Halioglobus sp. HI00S01]|uniref:hypothetical protein n=1 Tax=Halioglobus sp. HI00S01 TaxID=1822214 RepID=UPI0007C40677|nr:hypothetical protein [Halioglobus sp. HI00S01]KZX54922.1 hypothetical protein A3709_07870 [Halioglobus sp. HI00S01]